MEMEMKASEDIELGEDIIPPFLPLSFSLYDSFLSSHCSSCFSPLPPSPFPPLPSSHSPLHCSPFCSSLQFSSAESFLSSSPDSADLRAALRLLPRASSLPSIDRHRILGLLTNRDKLISSPDFSQRVCSGAMAMAAARKMRGGTTGTVQPVSLEEALLCLVITNAVEVQDESGRSLGIAVYGPGFSWINHSCSPNSYYRFRISPPNSSPFPEDHKIRISPRPAVARSEVQHGESDVCSSNEYTQGSGGYGPRVIVRSIKKIRKGEEVTVSYTDLMQPKAVRQSELWSKYQFICSCDRCSASPPTYVDHALEEISASSLNFSSSSSDHNFYREEATRMLTGYVDETIDEYLSVGDPESCCEKLENMLNLGLLIEQLDGKEGKSHLKFKLHPLHRLALTAYTTLASTYKIRSSDLLALHSDTEAFYMSRMSAAYSLLLAGATYHLFSLESSLMASAANYWTSAGESLLTLAGSSVWGLFVESGLPIPDLSTLAKNKCSKCSLIYIFDEKLILKQAQSADFENLSYKFLDCVTNMTPKIWSSLVHGCHHLKLFKDPIDFSWISNVWDFHAPVSSTDDCSIVVTEKGISSREAQGYSSEERETVYQLGVHCLLYGGFLANMCYGQNSHLTNQILELLHYVDNL